MRTASLVCALSFQILDTDARIDQALDRGSRREFRLQCQRRASLAARLQSLLLQVAMEQVRYQGARGEL